MQNAQKKCSLHHITLCHLFDRIYTTCPRHIDYSNRREILKKTPMSQRVLPKLRTFLLLQAAEKWRFQTSPESPSKMPHLPSHLEKCVRANWDLVMPSGGVAAQTQNHNGRHENCFFMSGTPFWRKNLSRIRRKIDDLTMESGSLRCGPPVPTPFVDRNSSWTLLCSFLLACSFKFADHN